ncbi:MAG: response regulator [Firmicutes bacterium]|nr:response regulator [Bacillota bacterium]
MDEGLRILVADASLPVREMIKGALVGEPKLQVVAEAADGRQAIDQALEIRPDVVFLDARLPKVDGLSAAEEILRHVSSDIVLLFSEEDRRLLRRAMQVGARDFLLKPFSQEELLSSVRDLFHQGALKKIYERGSQEGEVLTVFSTKGGVGKTTIASNLAAYLGERTQKRVLLLDLDLEFGSSAALLGLKPSTSIVDLCRGDGPIKPELLEKVILPTGQKNLFLLPAPPTPDLAAEVEGDGRRQRERNYVAEIISLAKSSFSHVVIDTASNFRETNLTALDRSAAVLLVTTPDIPTLQNTAKALDIMLQKLEYQPSRIRLILNRSDGAVGLTFEDISKGLAFPISYYVPSDGPTVIWAANFGQPFVLRRSRTAISRSIINIVEHLLNPASTVRVPSQKKERGWWTGFRKPLTNGRER